MTTGTPPMRSTSNITCLPNGLTSARCGTFGADPVKSASEQSTPASWAMASRCSTALVEPPNAITTAMAFSNASLVRMSRAVIPRRNNVRPRPAAGRAYPSRRRSVAGERAAGQRHAQRLGGTGHGVGGVHTAAGTLTRADRPLDGVDVLAGHQAARTGPTASKASMIVTSISVPSDSFARPGRIEPA